MDSRYPTFRGYRQDLFTILVTIKGHFKNLPPDEQAELDEWDKTARSTINEALDIIARPIQGSQDLETFAGQDYGEIEAYLNYVSTHVGRGRLYHLPKDLPVIDEMDADSLLSAVRRATRHKAPLPNLVYAPVMVNIMLNKVGLQLYAHEHRSKTILDARIKKSKKTGNIKGYKMQDVVQWGEHESSWSVLRGYLLRVAMVDWVQSGVEHECGVLNDFVNVQHAVIVNNWKVHETGLYLAEWLEKLMKSKGVIEQDCPIPTLAGLMYRNMHAIPFPSQPQAVDLPAGLMSPHHDGHAQPTGIHGFLESQLRYRSNALSSRQPPPAEESLAHHSFETLSPRKRSFYFDV